MAPQPGQPQFFKVVAKFHKIYNRGTTQEYTAIDPTQTVNGPFSSRESAEKFAAGLATHKLIAQVTIEEDNGKDEEVRHPGSRAVQPQVHT